ncbi:unnamed protein product [Heligmosomoides polygyrus]|uniref:UDP-glucuronosyltransferase n=1 Tax=Heligmosomoides polygyrus TaxID=6339 RepID=A0A3P8CIS3_HELPZ|nr:unnamed protein product [Heligmosomoides polygyrus]
MWTKTFNQIEFPHIWIVGDKALVEMLDEHTEEMNSVMNETWDLVVADELFSVSSYALALKAHQQGRPFVTLSTCIPTNLIKYHLSLGTPFAIRPSMYHRTAVPYEIEFFASRLHSTVRETHQAIRTQYVTGNVAVKGLNKLGFFDFDLSQLATKAAFYFLDDIESIIIPSPVSTGIAEVGFNCPTIKDLPRDYAEFVNDPISKGTILVAFGSNVVWDYAPQYTLDTFTDAMNRLREYRIIFSYNGRMDRIHQLGAHVMVTRWAPQKEILGHNRTVLFVSHGGLKSLKDTICGGVPVVYVPLFAEQSHNGEVARQAGFAEILQKNYMTADLFEEKVRLVLETPRYKEAAIRIRKFYLDRIIPSLDLAEFYIRRSLKTSPRSPVFKRKGMFISLFSHIYCGHFLIIAVLLYVLSR